MAGFNYAQNIIGIKKGANDIHELELEVAQLSASVLSIAEDVEGLQYSVVLNIEASTYATVSDALVAVETAYNNLSTELKVRTAIIRDNNRIYKIHSLQDKIFYLCWTTSDAMLIQSFDIKNHTFYSAQSEATGTTFADGTSSAQGFALSLVII